MTWGAARKAALERDDHTCQKCRRRSDLEVHHKKERVHGGTDGLENLITLCGLCHAEWTWCEPVPMSFDIWLAIPPARYLTALFAMAWPEDASAAEFKRRVLETIRDARDDYEAERT